jgi:predicted lipid-binding transport protein (Tim44 family)
MSKWLIAICVAVVGTALVIPDVEAARLGSKRSSGAERSAVKAPPAGTPAKPAQQQSGQTSNAAPAGQAAPAAAPQSGFAKWAPLLGGLAIGGLLGSMFGGSGFGALMGILLMVGLAIVAFMVIRALMQRGAAQQQPVQFAGGAGRETMSPPPSQVSGLDSRPQMAQTMASSAVAVPAGFDTAGFLRGAKMNFNRMQVANDGGNVDELRELTTPELFADLKRDLDARAGATQHTDVVSLEAELLEVVTEGDKHWASVRFSGMIRETPGAAAEPFQEAWNLVKPVDGSSGWLLAGIQQMD